MKLNSNNPAEYNVAPQPDVLLSWADDDTILRRAVTIMENRARKVADVMENPTVVKDYLRIKLFDLQHEVFGCVWLDAQHRVIRMEEMFRGTLSQTSVYPREVVKDAIKTNAGNVIFYHNHPSGVPDPSDADIALTKKLREALGLVDVNVLDHFIVAGSCVLSFAERGLI